MKFGYRNSKLIINLATGFLWLFYAVGNLYWEPNESSWFHYLFLLAGLFYVIFTLYLLTQKYIEITDEKIIFNSFPKQEILIKDLSAAEFNAPNYAFRTLKKEIFITKSHIRKKDLIKFEEAFEKIQKKIEKELLG